MLAAEAVGTGVVVTGTGCVFEATLATWTRAPKALCVEGGGGGAALLELVVAVVGWMLGGAALPGTPFPVVSIVADRDSLTPSLRKVDKKVFHQAMSITSAACR